MNILNEILYYNELLFISHILLNENKRFFFYFYDLTKNYTFSKIKKVN